MSNIPQEHKWRYFFHMTDIRNLKSIIENGLLCTNTKDRKGIQHECIANEDIQDRRAEMDVPCGNKGKVHDYVPFYFSSLNPMLLGVINKKNQDQPFIVYLCLKIDKMVKLAALFTDASANTVVPPAFYDDVKDLDKLSWNLIDSKKWSFDNEDERHKKMAEVLIHDKVDFGEVDAIVVYNNWIKTGVEKLLKEANITGVKVCNDFELLGGYKYKCYYTKFFIPGQELVTLVTGPWFLKKETEDYIKSILDARKNPLSRYRYQDVEALVTAVDINFKDLKELEGIYGLETDYVVHPETVSFHTEQVVKSIKLTEYYQGAEEHRQKVLELAAYLHDIGKGPKTKWKDGKQKVYPDHPCDAIPMLERILSKEIKEISEEDVRIIVLLVAYHDIIGDCMFRGRKIQEIVNIIKTEEELDMLFAISEADIKAIDTNWYQNLENGKKEFRNKILKLWKQG